MNVCLENMRINHCSTGNRKINNNGIRSSRARTQLLREIIFPGHAEAMNGKSEMPIVIYETIVKRQIYVRAETQPDFRKNIERIRDDLRKY